MTDKITSIRIDRELWKRAKIQCVINGESLREMLERLLRKELGDMVEGLVAVAEKVQ